MSINMIKENGFTLKKKTRSKWFPAEIMTDANYADDLVNFANTLVSPVGWGNRIHRLHLCRGVRTLHHECPGYMTLNSQMVRLQYCWSFIAIIPGPLKPGVVAPERVLSMHQIEIFEIYTECKQMTFAKLNC